MPTPIPAWTAVIPLRAGSRGLPGKNIRPLAGRPLYRHAVEQALAAGASRVLISTDIPEVLQARLPATVEVMARPPELAGDAVPMAPVLVHVLQAAQVSGPVVLLQSTSPLRTPDDIRSALGVYAGGAHELVMSVTDADRGVLKWGRVDGERFVPLSDPAHCFANRQSLPPVVKPNGAVYVFDADRMRATGSLASDRIGVVQMPPERSHDIDNLNDFERVEALLAARSADALAFPCTSEASPSWQCVLVCWGDKYGASIINNLVRAVAARTTRRPRFVLITDRDRPEVLPEVHRVRFPDYWLQPALRSSGCHAKLVMFEHGILPTDLPAIYVDLDTIVLGDLSQGLSLMDDRRTVAILPSALIPFGPVGRALFRRTRGRRYARGNSSFVVFHPAEHHAIAARFRELYARHPDFGFSPMIADERFISWVAQPHMKAIPKSFAVKFPGEFMFPWAPWLYLRAWLPWVRRRRDRLVAVTLNGLMIKPERLLTLPEGGTVVDEKSRKLVWSQRTLGTMKHKILDYYRAIL